MNLLSPDEQVAHLQNYVAKGGDDIDAITSLVRDVLDSGAWSHFVDQTGIARDNGSFKEFVTERRWRGLGTTRDALVAWVGSHDALTAERVEQAWRGQLKASRKPGGDRRSKDFQHGATMLNGLAVDPIVSRLKRDDPALAEQVVAGRITANAAARQKGWRKPRIVVSSPESVARSLRKHMTAADLTRLHDLLEQP